MREEEICVIRLRKQTRKRLKEFGKKGETYDDIVMRLMDKTSGTAVSPHQRRT